MTDEDLVAKKLAQIETYVAELRSVGRPQAIYDDLTQERFIEHTLQIAIQAALDVASHIVSDDRLGEPTSNRALFELMARHGWISEDRMPTLRDVVGFRNILVHGYCDVNLDVVRTIVEDHLDDLLDYVAEIRRKLG